MIKLLDKYIIKKFLSTYFFTLAIIMLLSMVFDISARLSEFIEKKAPLKTIFTDYYLNFLVYYGNTFSALIVFISVIWFTSKLAQDSEIIPMLFSTKPYARIIRPYFISATIITLFSLFITNYLLPISNKIRLDFEEKYYRDGMIVENYNAEFNNKNYVHFSNYNSEEKIVYDFTYEEWNDKNEPTYFIKAKKAENISESKRWKLTDYYERYIGKTNDILIVKPYKDTIFNFTINDLAFRDNNIQKLSHNELTSFIQREELKGNPAVAKFKMNLYERFSLPFATYVLTLIGVSVSSRKNRGGIGVNIAIGLGFVFLYIFAMKVTSVAAINVGFPAIIAAWTPNLIFGIIGLFLYKNAQK